MPRRAVPVRIGRALVRAARLPPREMLTMLHAIAVITVVEVLIRWVSLPKLSRLLGVPVNLEPGRPDVERLSVGELSQRTRRQLRCARRVADRWPFSRGPCLRRSLVAGHLIRRLGPTLRLGMVGSDTSLLAHAWVEIDGRPLERVDGYRVFQRLHGRIAT